MLVACPSLCIVRDTPVVSPVCSLGEMNMSFPSVARYRESGMSGAEALLNAVRTDCAEAVEFLHTKAHEAVNRAEGVFWMVDPNSTLGRQLIRIHASDAVRPLVEQHICHGQKLMFLNCCGGRVGGKKDPEPEELIRLQIELQNGVLAYADC